MQGAVLAAADRRVSIDLSAGRRLRSLFTTPTTGSRQEAQIRRLSHIHGFKRYPDAFHWLLSRPSGNLTTADAKQTYQPKRSIVMPSFNHPSFADVLILQNPTLTSRSWRKSSDDSEPHSSCSRRSERVTSATAGSDCLAPRAESVTASPALRRPIPELARPL